MKLKSIAIYGSFFLVASVSMLWAGNEKQGPPNVIFILTDDQGWGDARFAGHPYAKTPNLDKFAAQSTWFRQFYSASPVCSPSRCGFLTGHVPARHNIHGHLATHESNEARSMPDWLAPQIVTLPALLKASGYATAHFGKWHLGSLTGAPPPDRYGFDVTKTVLSTGASLGNEAKEPYFRARSTGLIVDEAIKFIGAHKDGPFYVDVWTLLPHAPLKPTTEQLHVYEALAPKADDPAFGPWMQKYLANAKNLKEQMKIYLASLTDLDNQLGRLFVALDQMGLAENTIVFFSSDNGAEDYRISSSTNAGVGNTGPLRARKRSLYEGGIRTFGLVRWPGHVAAGRRDETSVIGAVDLLPTVCKLTGVSVPANLEPDGEDVSDIWLGKTRPRSRPLFWEWLFDVKGDDYTPPALAVREGNWKLFINHDGSGPELYNIGNDIGEERNLAAVNPKIVDSLRQKTLAWVKTLPPSQLRDKVAKAGTPAESSESAPAKGKPKLNRDKIFKQWDSDRDNKLSKQEFKDGLKRDDEFEERFQRLDRNNDGQLSYEEFTRTSPKP